jgi:glycogen synthase
MQNGMQMDFSWSRQIIMYERVFRDAIAAA